MKTADRRRLMLCLGGVTAVILLQACASRPVTPATAMSVPLSTVAVIPVAGQSREQALQDKGDCYRIAQPGVGPVVGTPGGAPAGAVAAAGAGGAIVGALAGLGQGARGAAAGALMGGLLSGLVAGELADARGRPADPETYAGCLRQRGYDVDLPR